MDRLYYLGFSVFPGIGPVRFQQIIHKFGSAKDAWNSSPEDLKKEVGDLTASNFDKFRNTFDLKGYEKKLKDKSVQYLILKDKEYPELLKGIRKAPYVLYIKGSLDFDKSYKTIGIVGARKTTSYGREVTQSFTSSLVSLGFTIVSGLALGVDAVAAKTALENGGKTIAVLGSGVDVCHPTTNKFIYEQIINNGGAVVSAFPLGHPPSVGSFPARNRIIAGLSLGVLVTEGSEESGSLITAEDAFSMGRPVFAVPGPITSEMSKGPYKLIQKGAKLVTSPEEIIKELGTFDLTGQDKSIKGIKSIKEIKGDSKQEQDIINVLQNQALTFDEIVRSSKIEPSKAGAVLSMMEIKGLIISIEGGKYSLKV